MFDSVAHAHRAGIVLYGSLKCQCRNVCPWWTAFISSSCKKVTQSRLDLSCPVLQRPKQGSPVSKN